MTTKPRNRKAQNATLINIDAIKKRATKKNAARAKDITALRARVARLEGANAVFRSVQIEHSHQLRAIFQAENRITSLEYADRSIRAFVTAYANRITALEVSNRTRDAIMLDHAERIRAFDPSAAKRPR